MSLKDKQINDLLNLLDDSDIELSEDETISPGQLNPLDPSDEDESESDIDIACEPDPIFHPPNTPDPGVTPPSPLCRIRHSTTTPNPSTSPRTAPAPNPPRISPSIRLDGKGQLTSSTYGVDKENSSELRIERGSSSKTIKEQRQPLQDLQISSVTSGNRSFPPRPAFTVTPSEENENTCRRMPNRKRRIPLRFLNPDESPSVRSGINSSQTVQPSALDLLGFNTSMFARIDALATANRSIPAVPTSVIPAVNVPSAPPFTTLDPISIVGHSSAPSSGLALPPLTRTDAAKKTQAPLLTTLDPISVAGPTSAPPLLGPALPPLTKAEKAQKAHDFRKRNGLTERDKIKWRKKKKFHKFETPAIQWHVPPADNADHLPPPVDFFYRYLPKAFYDQAAEMTNLYAAQQYAEWQRQHGEEAEEIQENAEDSDAEDVIELEDEESEENPDAEGEENPGIGANLKKKKRKQKFKETNGQEIRAFIGIHILMGNYNYPRYRMYWNPVTKIPNICNAMPVNRFQRLRGNFHLVNNETAKSTTDRFWKVRPIYDFLRTRFQQLPLQANLCVDEQMVPFKGQLSVRQYMKNKPCKYGIKIFMLCSEEGQSYDFLLYQGENTGVAEDLQQFGAGASTVMQLHASRIREPNHCLYFDNYFTSYHLMQWLQNRQCFAVGTAQVKRFNGPRLMSDKAMKKKERGFAQESLSKDGQVLLTKWFDNRPVTLASNFVGIGTTDQCKRWDKKKKEFIEVPRPEVVKMYNQHMGGVDLLDFYISLYRIYMKSKKWTLRMIAHAIDLACVNAWLEYRRLAKELQMKKTLILDLLAFRTHVATALIEVGQTTPDNKRKRGRPKARDLKDPKVARRLDHEIRPLVEIRHDDIGHFPQHDMRKNSSRCKNGSCTGRSHFHCLKCNVHLCLSAKKNCFLHFHTAAPK